MEWLVILGLAGFAWWQAQRLEALSRRMAALEQHLAPRAAPHNLAPAQSAPPANAEEALLLDTPLPQASNDDEPPVGTPAAPEPHPEPLGELVLTEAMRVDPPVTAAPARNATRRLERWLAENALAYLGGGLLALGAIFLVAIAAQQSWFGPQQRLVLAVLFGASLIGAAEWAARRAGNALVASLLAGAGVVAIYATIWGAHALYGYVNWAGAGALLASASALLFALSFRHGQPLGVLAVIMALLAPMFASMPAWPQQALTLFVCAVGAAGFGLAALKRWAWVGAATLSGLYFWFAAAVAQGEPRRALAMLSIASLGALALAFRTGGSSASERAERFSWRQAQAFGPAAAISISSIGLLWVWGAIAHGPGSMIAGPAWVGAMFVALAGAAVRARIAPPAAFAVTVIALVCGIGIYITSRFTAFAPEFYPFLLFTAIVIAVSAMGARPYRPGRALIAGAGAIGAAALIAVSATTRTDWHTLAAWGPLFSGAAALFACAWLTARNTPEPHESWSVDAWAGAGAVLLLLAAESLMPAWTRTAAHAALALGLAAFYVHRQWRALSVATLTAAAIALAYAMRNAGLAISGTLPLTQGLAIFAGAAACFAAGAFLIARNRPERMAHEALSSAAVIIVLIAGFVVLRVIGSSGGAPLDSFIETALQALGLMAAGLVLLPSRNQIAGRISALRGHAFMAAGLLLVTVSLVLRDNPWWGGAPATINGPPIFNTLLLAFAAPAGLAIAAARRIYDRQPRAARAYAGIAAVLAMAWAALQVRHLFHGARMAPPDVAAFEAACYALLLLGAALAIAYFPRLRKSQSPFAADLTRLTTAVSWAALVGALLILLVARHPWWGAHAGATTGIWQTSSAIVAHVVAIVAVLLLGRALSQTLGVKRTRFAAAATAALLAWSTGHAVIRWLYHFGAMDDGGPMRGLEAFAHALWPLGFVVAASGLCARAPGRDRLRAYVLDLQAIWSAAVWPVTTFAALGLWFVFNPWWGLVPAHVQGALGATGAFVLLLSAAWLTLLTARIALIRGRDWFARWVRVGAIGHILIALVLAARAAFHHGVIAQGMAPAGVEMWTYSAVLALLGASVLALGAVRDDATMRWSGLGLLFAATLKVFVFDMAQLSGVIRVASFVGLGVVFMLTALAMRKVSREGASPRPTAPHETPRVRSQSSQ